MTVRWVDILGILMVFVIGVSVGLGTYSLSQPSDGVSCVRWDITPPNEETALETPTDDSKRTLDVTSNTTHVRVESSTLSTLSEDSENLSEVRVGGYTFERLGDNRVTYNGDEWVPDRVVNAVNDAGWYVEW